MRATLDAIAVPGVVEDLSPVEAAEQVLDSSPTHRLVEEERLLARELLGRQPRPVGQLERDLAPLLGNRQLGLDDCRSARRRWIEDRDRAARHPPATVTAARRASVEPICSASAKRTRTWSTTGSMLHPQIESCAEFSITLPPRQAQEGFRPRLGRDVEGGQRLGVALEPSSPRVRRPA